MHVERLTIENTRPMRRLELDLRRETNRAGWHVLLGENGAGKSTVVRALALALMGQSNAYATRQDWSRWLATGSGFGQVSVALVEHRTVAHRATRSGTASGDDAEQPEQHGHRRERYAEASPGLRRNCQAGRASRPLIEYRMLHLDDSGLDDVWFATHEEVARYCLAAV